MTQSQNCIYCLKQYKLTFYCFSTVPFKATTSIYAKLDKNICSFSGGVHRIFAEYPMMFTLSEAKWHSSQDLNQRLQMFLVGLQKISDRTIQSLGLNRKNSFIKSVIPVLLFNWQEGFAEKLSVDQIVLSSHSEWGMLHFSSSAINNSHTDILSFILSEALLYFFLYTELWKAH